MQLNMEQKAAVIKRVEHFVELANSRYGKSMPVPTVLFTKQGTTAGTARGDFEVNFNATLLLENWDEFMNDTIPHEVAHCVTNHVFGQEYRITRTGKYQRISHGVKWKGVMRDFGCDPSRCHGMDVSNARQGNRTKTKYEYRCMGCGASVPVGPKYHKDIQNGRNLKHKCAGRGQRGALEFVGVLGKVTYAEAAQGKAPAAKKVPARTQAPKGNTQIAQAVDIYLVSHSEGITARQDIMKKIMVAMGVEKGKAAQLHDRAKKKCA